MTHILQRAISKLPTWTTNCKKSTSTKPPGMRNLKNNEAAPRLPAKYHYANGHYFAFKHLVKTSSQFSQMRHWRLLDLGYPLFGKTIAVAYDTPWTFIY